MMKFGDRVLLIQTYDDMLWRSIFFPQFFPPPICYTYMFPIAKHNFKRKLYNDLIY